MTQTTFLKFWLLLSLGLVTAVFNSCSKEDEKIPNVIAVTDISLDITSLVLMGIDNSYTLRATVTPNNATNKTITWTSSDKTIVTVNSNGTITAIAKGTATITAEAEDKTATCRVRIDEVVEINGVIWATCNVDAPGVFAAKPESPGMFYQWNRKKAWAATGGVTGWNETMPGGDHWKKANDPSPAGWRIPTLVEIETLFDTEKVSNKWTTENGVNGRRFTDKTSGNSIFLPAIGYRDSNGTLDFAGSDGGYWSSTPYGTIYAYNLHFYSDGASRFYGNRTYGFSVRCVIE